MPHYGSGSALLHPLPRTRVLGAGRHAGVGLPLHHVRPVGLHPKHLHPMGHARPHPMRHSGKIGLGEWDEGLGKFNFKKSIKAGVRSVKSVAKVAGGAVGFKHGLTAKQLKYSKVVRKVGLLVAGVAGAVLLAPLAIAAAGHLTGLGATGAAGMIGKLKTLRKAAGLPPISADTISSTYADQKAKDPTADEATLEARTNEVLSKAVADTASPAAAAEAAKIAREMVPAEVAQRQIAAAPPAQQAELAGAVETASVGGVGMDWKQGAAMAAVLGLALLYTRKGAKGRGR